MDKDCAVWLASIGDAQIEGLTWHVDVLRTRFPRLENVLIARNADATLSEKLLNYSCRLHVLKHVGEPCVVKTMAESHVWMRLIYVIDCMKDYTTHIRILCILYA